MYLCIETLRKHQSQRPITRAAIQPAEAPAAAAHTVPLPAEPTAAHEDASEQIN